MTAPAPWNRFSPPVFYAPSETGAPLAGAKLYFYESGTTMALNTYQDQELSTPNENPVVANAAGQFVTEIFLLGQSYKVVLTDADGVQIWSKDPVSPFVPTDLSTVTFNIVECTVDGNGGVPAVGVCGDAYCEGACTILKNVLQANGPGDLVIDIWATTFVTNSPPSAINSITADAPPTLAASQSSLDSTLVGWTTAVGAGTAFRFNIVSITDITRFTLTLVAQASV